VSPSDRLWLSRHLRRAAARYELRHMDEERRDALEIAERFDRISPNRNSETHPIAKESECR
jgi:hypothetical protein